MDKVNLNNNSEVRPKYLGKVILALVLAAIVFASVFFLGYLISYNQYQSVTAAQEKLRYDLLSFDIENSLLGDSCTGFDPYRFSDQMSDMGQAISLLEDRLGKNDAKVLEQKKTYALLEARHFLYVKDHNTRCSDNYTTILFFYSNAPEFIDSGDKLGYMLSSLKNKDNRVFVYSFDYNLDSSLTSLLKEKYKVVQPNTLVINEKTYINSFNDVTDVEALI